MTSNCSSHRVIVKPVWLFQLLVEVFRSTVGPTIIYSESLTGRVIFRKPRLLLESLHWYYHLPFRPYIIRGDCELLLSFPFVSSWLLVTCTYQCVVTLLTESQGGISTGHSIPSPPSPCRTLLKSFWNWILICVSLSCWMPAQ